MEFALDDDDRHTYDKIIDTDQLAPLVQLCSECKVPMKPTGKLYRHKPALGGGWSVESICPSCNDLTVKDDYRNREVVQRIAEEELKKLG